MRWHRAVVTEQHPPEVGTELLFDTGETDLLDLNTQRWRPYSVSPLNVLMSASEELEDAARGMFLLANGNLKNKESQLVEYPDCSKLNIDKLPK